MSASGRATAPQPAPPQPKFVLHDVTCPHTSTYLGELYLQVILAAPLLASIFERLRRTKSAEVRVSATKERSKRRGCL